jgi:hypothetical protein
VSQGDANGNRILDAVKRWVNDQEIDDLFATFFDHINSERYESCVVRPDGLTLPALVTWSMLQRHYHTPTMVKKRSPFLLLTSKWLLPFENTVQPTPYYSLRHSLPLLHVSPRTLQQSIPTRSSRGELSHRSRLPDNRDRPELPPAGHVCGSSIQGGCK